MSKNTVVVRECDNCGAEFNDRTVSKRLHAKYCPRCQRAYNKAIDDTVKAVKEKHAFTIQEEHELDSIAKILKAGGNS
jgi:protein-arginine kinase activator protein McsA